MLSAIAIAGGYIVLVLACGWPGLIAAVVHIAIMLGSTKRLG